MMTAVRVHVRAIIALFAALTILSACNVLPQTPRQVLAATYVTAESLADTAYIAHRDGHITDQQRDAVRNGLVEARNYLNLAREQITMGGDGEDPLLRAQGIIRMIESALQELTDER